MWKCQRTYVRNEGGGILLSLTWERPDNFLLPPSIHSFLVITAVLLLLYVMYTRTFVIGCH